MPGVLTPRVTWGGWTGRMRAGNGHRGCGGMDSESLVLPKSSSVPIPLLPCARGLNWEVFKLCSLFQTCPSVLGTVWDGFLLPKGVSSACTRHCPRNTEVTTPLEGPAADLGHDLALVLGGWAGLGTKGFVLPVLAKETAPREMPVPGRTQQAGFQDRRCELKTYYSDNDHK